MVVTEVSNTWLYIELTYHFIIPGTTLNTPDKVQNISSVKAISRDLVEIMKLYVYKAANFQGGGGEGKAKEVNWGNRDAKFFQYGYVLQRHSPCRSYRGRNGLCDYLPTRRSIEANYQHRMRLSWNKNPGTCYVVYLMHKRVRKLCFTVTLNKQSKKRFWCDHSRMKNNGKF